MSEARRSLRWAVALLVLAVSAAAGAYVAATLAPERLRREVERQVAAATGAPCRIGSLHVAPGLPIEIEGRDVGLWDRTLVIPRARARVSIAAALIGEVRLSRLVLEGARLEVVRSDPDGAEDPPDPPGDAPEDLLAALHDLTGRALAALSLADKLQVRDARMVFAAQRGGEPDFTLEDIHVRLSQSRLRRDSALVAQARIRSGDEHRGLVEWNGARREGEPLRLAIAVTELDLGWLGRLAPDDRGRSDGWLTGVVDITLDDREHARIELDLVARDFAWRTARRRKPLFRMPRVSALADLAIEPGRVAMHAARVRGGPIDAVIDGRAERPLGRDSAVDFDLRIRDVSIDDLLALLTSTPAPWVEDARDVLESLDGGRVASFRARARGPLSQWGVTSQQARGLPPGLSLSAELEDLRVALAADDAIENVSLRAKWQGDRVSLRDVIGLRAGRDLPRLDLELEGVSRLLDADLARRVPESDHVLLEGLPLLISLFEPAPGSRNASPDVTLHLSHLDHPAVLWPLRSLELHVSDGKDRLVGDLVGGTWAGVPLEGRLTWRSDPMHLTADLVAVDTAPAPPEDPVSSAPAEGLPLEGVVWAEGRFEIGPLSSRLWSHRSLRGRVRAARSRIAFDAVEAETPPGGRVDGDAVLELDREDALPWRAVFTARDLDADRLFSQMGLGRGLVAGRVAARGDLRGRYERGVEPTAALDGDLHLVASNGHVRKDLPAVLALTLAGEGLDFRTDREVVRYTTCESRLELSSGVATTDAMEFEGPDLRMFGSGSLDLGHPPHALDSEVVVFLFRPVDRLLGAVPIVGDLILGGSDNLFAAYFRLEGPWDAPTATYQPLRSFNAGPLRLVTGLPTVVRRGIESLGTRTGGGDDGAAGVVVAPPPGNGAVP